MVTGDGDVVVQGGVRRAKSSDLPAVPPPPALPAVLEKP
jgi:hypothetical protein